MSTDAILKGSIAFLAIALIAIIVVRQISGDEAEAPVATSSEAAIAEDEADFPDAESYCAEAQENYDNVMNMYSDRGSSDIMEQALVEAEEQVSRHCDG